MPTLEMVAALCLAGVVIATAMVVGETGLSGDSGRPGGPLGRPRSTVVSSGEPGWWGRLRARLAAQPLVQALEAERRLLHLLVPYWRQVGVGLAISAGAVGIDLAKPWPTKILVDDVLGKQRLWGLSASTALSLTVALTLVLFVVSGGMGLLQTRVLFGLSQRLISDLRAQLFGHLTRLSLRYHDTRGAGDNLYRITTDSYSVQSVLLEGLIPLVAAVLTLVGTFAVMVRLDLVLAILATSSMPLAAVITQRMGNRISTSSLTLHERESEVYTNAEQTLVGIRTVQAFGREEFETELRDHAIFAN